MVSYLLTTSPPKTSKTIAVKSPKYHATFAYIIAIILQQREKSYDNYPNLSPLVYPLYLHSVWYLVVSLSWCLVSHLLL